MSGSTGGGVSLVGFWARRARRLLPAATLVLVVTAVATALLMPPNQVSTITRDVWWAALFSGNWRFAQQGTDYFAQDRATSPVQHYWSLGVEEQFYLLWPLIVVAVGFAVLAFLRRRAGRADRADGAAWAGAESLLRRDLAVVAALVVVVSFVYEWRLSSSDQPYAYFGTPSRAWQLGLGALLAAGLPWCRRLTPLVRQVLAVAGVAGLGWAFLRLDEQSGGLVYPGWIALVPTLAAAALVVAGSGAVPTLVGRLMARRPLVWLGDISYSLYLWHFPILVIGTTRLAPAGWLVRVVLVVASVVVAWASCQLVETPVRHLRPLAARPALSIGVGVALVAVSTSASALAPHLAPSASVVMDAGHRVDLGDQLIDPNQGDLSVPGCTAISFESSDFGACDAYGAPGASRRVILIGDSHAGALAPGLSLAAKQHDWAMTVWSKPGCNLAATEFYDTSRKTPKTACAVFRQKVLARTIAEHPALVVLTDDEEQQVYVSGTPLSYEDSQPVITQGLHTTVSQLTAAGLHVVVVADWPHYRTGPATCLIQTRDVDQCTVHRTTGASLEEQATADLPGVRVVDLTPAWCRGSTCRPVVGDTLVYRRGRRTGVPSALLPGQPHHVPVKRERCTGGSHKRTLCRTPALPSVPWQIQACE